MRVAALVAAAVVLTAAAMPSASAAITGPESFQQQANEIAKRVGR
jgi:hypothetical protein